eukprot:1194906-Prorocentrum_minimum.AAC.2
MFTCPRPSPAAALPPGHLLGLGDPRQCHRQKSAGGGETLRPGGVSEGACEASRDNINPVTCEHRLPRVAIPSTLHLANTASRKASCKCVRTGEGLVQQLRPAVLLQNVLQKRGGGVFPPLVA